MAAAVTALCALIACPYCYFAARHGRRHAELLMALVTVPYLTSILIRSYAWVAILGNHGPVNRALLALGVTEAPVALVFNTFGSYLGTVHVLLPMIALPLYAGMRRISPALLQAGRGLGGSPAAVFATVFLPLSLPGLGAGAALVFLSALGFYITPALLGAPGDYLLAQAIEVRVSTLGEFDVAAALSCLLLLLATSGGLLLARRRIAPFDGDGSARPTVAGAAGLRRRRLATLRWPRAAEPLAACAAQALASSAGPLLGGYAGVLLAVLLAPMAVVVALAFSSAPYLTFPPPGYALRWFRTLAADGAWLASAGFSLWIALAAAVTALAAGTPLAFALARGRHAARRGLWLLAVSPMILPHIVIGLGMFFCAVALGINGRPASFWLAYAVIGLPYVVIILLPALERLDGDLERAAASLGASPAAVLRTVTLPLLAVSLASALLFAFLAGFDDLIIGLFLSSPKATTLAVRMWEDISMEISPKTAVVGTLQLVVVLGVMAASWAARKVGKSLR
ncbi:ABC transporter permease subunit [Xylophilus sp.]|uniref:ABC transporter permease subunit n=1 Tax=Xylophilus sp. TaxID=2653893 RepID=UPI0013B69B49|nr:ABC transporter permease subunit [Xylophilus sp.]KAF1048380.1 MAG: Putrescine transport system permease protein PotH [Xylophilus sp.]